MIWGAHLVVSSLIDHVGTNPHSDADTPGYTPLDSGYKAFMAQWRSKTERICYRSEYIYMKIHAQFFLSNSCSNLVPCACILRFVQRNHFSQVYVKPLRIFHRYLFLPMNSPGGHFSSIERRARISYARFAGEASVFAVHSNLTQISHISLHPSPPYIFVATLRSRNLE
ncbi:uncharacterized protein FOMMEDRAFT_156857 [Fomitiporia mediterranea MF3/22]|uniref:uncharacterized protein n=1 Tax=Fomitiporia mediterranea (strain MF3/22) TaxID=694068 RepID=UPI000440792E|nr:uncharacterized protein FOMMEDRAFT_156857 [Fomitiporia mediterranea MF3/22]EJD03445.1 hypothetical protein FOMMEDRAFT_156857 [Fomitiporia mediterranea MF3/22]